MNPGQKKSLIKHVLINIFIAAFISFLIFSYLIEIYRVKGKSMEPLLFQNNRILVLKSCKNFERFQVVVLYSPEGKKIVKRIIGLPQEKIEIREGNIYINDKLMEESSLTINRDLSVNCRAVKLKGDEFYVLGDNMSVSIDSKLFGPVKHKNIKGRVIASYWPLDSLHIIR